MNGPVSYRIGKLAEDFGLELRGDPDIEISGIGTLAGAGKHDLSFLANPRYSNQLASSGAAAVIVPPDAASGDGPPRLVSENPYLSYARVAALFDGKSAAQPGIHPSAVVDPDAHVDPTTSIGPFCVIEAGTSIGPGSTIGAHAYIGANCVIGSQCQLHPRATLACRVRLGNRVIIHPGAVLGAEGFGLAPDGNRWQKVPQLGGVVVGDDSEVGANTTIDRGAIDDTVLGVDVHLDNQIQIAHNVVIGDHTAIAGCAAIAGSARIGKNCLIGGGAGILGHLEVADRVTITAMSLVTRSIEQAGEYSSGTPLQANRAWRRNAVRMKQLDELARRVAKLENTTPHE